MTQRGKRRQHTVCWDEDYEADQDVFFVDGDRPAQLDFLREYCERFAFNAPG